MTATVQAACLFAALAEPSCCGMTRGGNHSFTCPLALAEVCVDCGSGPGEPCFPFCYAVLGEFDDETPQPQHVHVLAVIDDDTDALIRWHRIVDMLRPYVISGMFDAFTCADSTFPLADRSPFAADVRTDGWIDQHGMVLPPHHRHRPFTVAMTLACREHLHGPACTARLLTAVPVVLKAPLPVPGEGDALCRCGHRADHHDGSGPTEAGCARWSGTDRWCGCLALRPVAAGASR